MINEPIMRVRKPQKIRGIAMLLVLISLMTASILTVAYVASRDNSAIIGENIASSAAARWGSDSGIDLGLAVLQTNADWRGLHNHGVIIDGHQVGDSDVSVSVRDLESNSVPGPMTEFVMVTSTATANGVEQVSTAMAYVPSPLNQGVDLDLSEFAIYATESVSLSNESIVTRWPMAPLSMMGQPVPIATQSLAAGSITLSNNAAIIDGQVYAAPGSSVALVSSASGQIPEVIPLSDALPMPSPPQSNMTDPSNLSLAEKLLHLTLDIVGGLGLINTNTRVSDAKLTSNATRTLRGPITFTSNDDLELQNSKILIEGAVKIVVFDDLILQNSSIELKAGSKLMMYVADTVSLQDSYIGDLRANTLRDSSGLASPINPDRIKIFRIPQYTGGANWTLSANSVMKASVYATGARFEIKDQSALYGRVAAAEVELSGQGALFYDPSLSRNTGFTDLDSPLYDEDGLLDPSVKTLTSLDTSSLQTLADSTDLLLKPATDEVSVVQPNDYADTTPDLGAPTEPTPRPVVIQYERTSRGVNVRTWEHQ